MQLLEEEKYKNVQLLGTLRKQIEMIEKNVLK